MLLDFLNIEIWIALFTLIGLEVVLAVDNVIVISILVAKLPEHQRQKARIIGLSFAMIARILLLTLLAWIAGLIEPLFSIFGKEVSGRDLVLFFGGLFLIVKSASELYELVNQANQEIQIQVKKNTYFLIILQIVLFDIVFSFDSVITAISLINELILMIVAIVVAVILIMFAAKPIGDFIEKYPTIKTLALSFLVLIGLVLVLDSFGIKVPKEMIYSVLGFSIIVEFLNIKIAKGNKP